MDGVGAFFAASTPQDWTTAGLALFAALLSIATIAQTQLNRARPRFAIEWGRFSTENENRTLIATCRVRNDGDAVARDVRLRVEAQGMRENLWTNDRNDTSWHRWAEFPPGLEPQVIEVPLEPASFDRLPWTKNPLSPRSNPDTEAGLPPGGSSLHDRETALRPTVTLRYRGKIRPVRWRTPPFESRPSGGGCW